MTATTPAAPSRVLLAGDWHGNRDWASACIATAEDHECQAVLQLGDFGLWPGRHDEWLDHVDALAERHGVRVLWLDGNHEDHDALERWRARADDRGVVAMRPRVAWASRGARWEWSGWRFGALGGAVSIDRFLRRQGVNWWPQEAPTEADVDRLGDERLDVLATHAAPASNAIPYRPLPLPEGITRDARKVRDLVTEAVRRTRPRLVVHGHYHLRLSYEVGGARVEGLAHDRAEPASEAWAVLDLGRELAVGEPPGS